MGSHSINSAVIERSATLESGFPLELEKRFLAFGTSVLTAREVELTRLLLKGYSPKHIAALVGITQNTATVHSKNIYRKLDVHSHQQLFGLFLEAIGHEKADGSCDPLSYF